VGLYLVFGGLFLYILYRERALSYFSKVFLSGMIFLSYLSRGYISSTLIKIEGAYLGEVT
jgi:hypothetical protein